MLKSNEKKKHFYCYLCERKAKQQALPSFNGTTGARNYLKGHKIDLKAGALIEEVPIVKEVMEVVTKRRAEVFKKLLIQWFVYCHIALAMLKNQYFRDLISYYNTSLGTLLPYARSTLRISRGTRSAYRREHSGGASGGNRGVGDT